MGLGLDLIARAVPRLFSIRLTASPTAWSAFYIHSGH